MVSTSLWEGEAAAILQEVVMQALLKKPNLDPVISEKLLSRFPSGECDQVGLGKTVAGTLG